MKAFGFPKSEKLKQKREIDLLFAKGKWITCGSLRVINLKLEDTENVAPKVGVSVSKKFFKKAVDRNRIKRLLREVYRLNKNQFREILGNHSLTMLFWVSKTAPKSYQELEENFKALYKQKAHQNSK